MKTAFNAEQAVVGAVMLAGDAKGFFSVSDILKPADFTEGRHALLWEVFSELVDRNSPIDPVTVGEWVEANGIDGLAGGTAYVLELANNTPSAANIRSYAEIVAERSRLREVRRIGAEIAACDDSDSAAEIAARYTGKLLEISGRRNTTAVTWRQAITQAFTEMRSAYDAKGVVAGGIVSPWTALNDIILALRPADLCFIAGRPGMGKTAVALNWILHAANAGRVMAFSLEMSAAQLAVRGMAMKTQVPIRWMRQPGDEDYWSRITGAIKEQRDLQILVDEDAGLTIDQICARAIREHQRSPLSLVTIDHTHLIDLGANHDETRHAGARLTGAMKRLAKRLGIPVIALAQLNRGVEQRADKRPMMSDLREFGSIEQDADQIVFCYRDDYYYPNSMNPGNLELIVAKNRDGASGTAHVSFTGSTNAIEDHEFGWQLNVPAPKAQPDAPERGFARKSRSKP